MSGFTIVGGALVSPAGAALSASRVGNAPVVPRGAVRLGTLSGSKVLNVDVVLQPRNPAALAAFATAVSTPGSSLYRDYLPAGAFPARFGPTASTIDSVRDWLKAQGVRPSAISADHLYFSVTATAGALEKAFSVGFDSYEVAGRVAYANTSAPEFGGAVAGAIQGVIGLDDLTTAHHSSMFAEPQLLKPNVTPQVVTGGPQPCSSAITAGVDGDSYTADQLASSYRFSSLYEAGDQGSGETVALFELEPNLPTDIAAYQSCYGTNASVTYIPVEGGAGTGAGEGEAALDIEDVIGLAPKAAIDVYQAPNSDAGVYADYSDIASQDAAKAVSTSWGLCEAQSSSTILTEENTVFEMAASQGQSVFAAAGDDGSEDCGGDALGVDDPGSQPYVTSVGGTTLDSLGPPPNQSVWNEGGAGGGGISEKWAMPSYQSGAPGSLNVINSHSSGTACGASAGSYCREVPDVSADADPYTGYVIYYKGSWTGIGGTSAAAPLWAALTALTDAWSGCTGKGLGFANPALYTVADGSSYATSFNDITSGNNDYTATNGGLFPAGTGFDMASGLGTPNVSDLPSAVCGEPEVTVTYPKAETSTKGKAAKLQIKASDSDGETLSYKATGLPKGLKISASTGLISGTAKTAGKSTVTVTAKDTGGSQSSVTFSWTVKS